MEWFPSLDLRRKALEITAQLAATYRAEAPHRGQVACRHWMNWC